MIDQLNRKIIINNTPTRIISLVPSQTELLVDLGLEPHIVGITKFCIHPNELRKSKTIVGGTKNIKIEKIKELKPDIILCNKEENTKEIVEICEKIAPTHVSDIFTLEDAKGLILQYGKLFSIPDKAEEIINKLNHEIVSFKTFIKNRPYKKVAYFIWRDPWMVAGNNTFINHLLLLNKFENIFSNQPRYPQIDIDNTIQAKNPDLILLSSEPYPFKEKHIIELQEKTYQSKILLVDGEMFSWYGSRLLKAFDYFKRLNNRI
ncbi:iron complex transport system substrate-binding protein [Tenacibaculum sp. 190524A02b]|uniref:Iron complex transport system substrate-binding protein n=1 Tax=Tenacibaculum vairaonense TaxID=3137860 RepID=A0ABM9PKF6_9FLAO